MLLTFPETPRFFLDSSVILAGCASPKGASHVLLVLGAIGFLQLSVTTYVFDEVEFNATYKLPQALAKFNEFRVSIQWEMIEPGSEEVVRRWTPLVPFKDAWVLEAAVRSKPARFITLDRKHFLNKPDVASQSGLVMTLPEQAVREIRASIAGAF